MQEYRFDCALPRDHDLRRKHGVADKIGLGFAGVAHQLLDAVQLGRRDAGAQPLAAEAGIVFAWPAARAAFLGLPGHQRSLWVTQGTQWAESGATGF